MNQASEARFTAEDFKKREVYRENYLAVGGALLELLEFDSVLDLGCANGFLLEQFWAVGKSIRGVELSSEVFSVLPIDLRPQVTVGDATSLGRVGQFDLVSCVEVAEHIPPERSLGLIDSIVANATKWIYFTAASPCQPGHGHINCRQQFFWMNEFRKRGVGVDWDKTEKLIERIQDIRPAQWLAWNSVVFRVAGQH